MGGVNKQAIIAIVAVVIVIAVVLVFRSMSGGDVNKDEINAQVKKATETNVSSNSTPAPAAVPGAAGLPGGKRH
jgi:cell division protein FtsL